MANKNASNTNLTVSSAGAINYPSQPAFLAYLSSQATNVTGNNTIYTVLCDTEVIDQGGNYVPGTGIFTAPVTGLYNFTCGITVSSLGAATLMNLFLSTTTQSFFLWSINPATIASGGIATFSQNTFAQMTAGNTVTMRIQVNGIGADTADIDGHATDFYTWFGGMLVA